MVKKPARATFSLSNPYILESVPDYMLKELSIFEGKKLNMVCRVLDDKNYPQILSAFKKIITKSFSEAKLQKLYKKSFPWGKVPSDIARGAGAGLGTAGGCAYRDGSFILLSEKDKLISDSGIKSVIVNDVYYPIMQDLRKKFPNVNFMRADEAANILNKI